MRQPLIGITTSRGVTQHRVPTFTATQAYVEAISQAGGAPVLIPLGLDEPTLLTLTNRLDGILFSGGGDLQPDNYGSAPHPLVADVDPDRDRIELWLVEQVFKIQLPFLGICRGFQVINVGMGGTLYEDILDQHPAAQKHDYFPGHARSFRAHTVRLQANSHLAALLQAETIPVNSLHHQGVRQIAASAVPSAYAEDGILEGLEFPDHPFGLAVQWHPEWLRDDPAMRRIFSAFIQAASGNSASDE